MKFLYNSLIFLVVSHLTLFAGTQPTLRFVQSLQKQTSNQTFDEINTSNQANIIYVDQNVQGGDGSGSSWSNAFPELADALKWAKFNETQWSENPLQIWVAGGTYLPKYRPDNLDNTNATDRTNTFLLVNNVHLYGGFIPGATTLESRLTASATTIISGDFNNDDTKSGAGRTLTLNGRYDNAKRLFIGVPGINAVIDGFKVIGGFQSNSDNETIMIDGTEIFQGSGSAFLIYGANVTIRNCEITENEAFTGGAAFVYHNGSIIIENSIFKHNKGSWGVVENSESTLKVWNSLFLENRAEVYGAGIDANGQNAVTQILNSTFLGNYSNRTSFDLGVSASNSHVEIYNSVILNSAEPHLSGAAITSFGGTFTISSSLVQGLTNGDLRYFLTNTSQNNADDTNLTESDVFEDYIAGNFFPKPTSVLVERGSQTIFESIAGSVTLYKDLAGNNRLQGESIDIGAFESEYVLIPLTSQLITDSGSDDTDGITNVKFPIIGGLTLAGAQVAVKVNETNTGSVIADGSGNWQFTFPSALPDGNYSITVDATMNSPVYVSTGAKTINIVIDATAPVIYGVTEGEIYNEAITVTYSDGIGELNGNAIPNGSTISSEGNHVIKVTDLAGNITIVNFSIVKPVIVPSDSRILYVNKSVTGGNRSGDSWQNAIPELADALVYARNNKGDYNNTERLQIWVAAGTYKPQFTPFDLNFGSPGGRTSSFLMVDFVDVYGGFSGVENQVNQRNAYANPTILDGDLLGNDAPTLLGDQLLNHDSRSDNAYHVVLYSACYSAEAAGILDGFHIINGNANHSTTSSNVNGFKFGNNWGGGINSIVAFANLNNLIFRNNSAFYGGAIYQSFSTTGGVLYVFDLKIGNSLFENNHGIMGSAIDASTQKGTITNCTFINNTKRVGYPGSAINGSKLNLINVISINPDLFEELQTDYYGSATYTNVYNSLLFGVSNTENNNLDGTGITANDLFLAPEVGNFQLKQSSVVINAGDNSKYTDGGYASTGKDLANKNRISGTIIDLGAFEYQEDCPVLAAPVTDPIQNFCGAYYRISDLTATTTNGANMVWYATATETNPLNINSLLQSQQYYVAAELYGCESAERSVVNVNVSEYPNMPVVTSPYIFTLNEEINTLPISALPNHTLRWFDDDYAPISPPVLNTLEVGSANYYVSQINELGCESIKAYVEFRVIQQPLIPDANGRIYVNKNNSGGNNKGDSWQNAIPELSVALENAFNNSSIREIWVAASTYYPLYGGDGMMNDLGSSNMFNITNLKVYGGFSGGETNLNQRNWYLNSTILSADIGIKNDNTDNSELLVASMGATRETIIDGFIIEKSNGLSGVAFFGSAERHIINHCIIRENYGIFGGVTLQDISPVFIANTQIIRNSGIYSGGLGAVMGAPQETIPFHITSSLFYGNKGQDFAGGVFSMGKMRISNTIFWGNELNGPTQVPGSDILSELEHMPIVEPDVFNSLTQVFVPTTNPGLRTLGTVITGLDPLFSNESTDDFSLQQASPAIDAGDNSYLDVSLLGTRDLTGADRIRNGYIDLGTHEVQLGDNPLPLRLISFTSSPEAGGIGLIWRTADEINTSHFEVERSHDAKNFEQIGLVESNVTGDHTYRFTDINPNANGNIYYRLRMVDLDGTYTYSRAISLNKEAFIGLNQLEIYPNPSVSGGEVVLTAGKAARAKLISVTGQKVGDFLISEGKNILSLPQLKPGVYLIITDDGQSVRVIIK